MDFMNRAVPGQPQPQRPVAPSEPVEPRGSGRGGKGPKNDLIALGTKVGMNALIFIIALLIAAIAWFTYTAQPSSQAKYISNNKLQAVFLNSGQVYFGNISALNSQYLVLQNVYYLQSASSTTTTSNQNVSLIKLGCELHKPYDEMVVNTSQVTFWENLQADGQVAKAVAQFQQQNPKGQQCSNQPAPANSGSNLQSQSSNTTTPPKQ